MPGQALPAGTYLFKMIDSSTENKVMQVFSQDARHLFATFLTVPDRGMNPANKPVIFFEERPSYTTEAVRAVFCRGDQYVRQLVYPHNAAVAIAKRTHQKVLQVRDDKTHFRNADVTTVDESGQQSKPNPK